MYISYNMFWVWRRKHNIRPFSCFHTVNMSCSPDKQTDLYERQRKMPGGKTLSTPCEGNTVMSDPALFVGRNVGNIGKWWSDVECKKIEVDTGHSHEMLSCASIYRFISIHVRWCSCNLHICVVINICHQYRILVLHPTPLSISQFWKVPNSRGFIPSDGLSLMDVFQKESYQVSEYHSNYPP